MCLHEGKHHKKRPPGPDNGATTTMKPARTAAQSPQIADYAFNQGVFGGVHLILLHCVSGYPTPPEDANLLTIPDMRKRFGVPVGLSDHTLGTAVAVAATALGAVAIEKHFTLARADGGVDSAFSIEPHELEQLVRDTAIAFKALGDVNYERKSSEKGNMVFRRSLYAVKDIAAGEELTAENMRSIRPGYGLKPKHYDKVLGRRAKVAIPRGTPLSWDLLE